MAASGLSAFSEALRCRGLTDASRGLGMNATSDNELCRRTIHFDIIQPTVAVLSPFAASFTAWARHDLNKSPAQLTKATD